MKRIVIPRKKPLTPQEKPKLTNKQKSAEKRKESKKLRTSLTKKKSPPTELQLKVMNLLDEYNIKYEFQKVSLPFLFEFWIKGGIVLEIDGKSLRTSDEKKRLIKDRGVKILPVSRYLIENNSKAIIEDIKKLLGSHK
jgi:very-short-patch-repair endonuclease